MAARLLLCTTLVLYLATVASAAPVTIRLTAEVVGLIDDKAVLGNDVKLGDTIIADYTYDADTVDSEPDATAGVYWHGATPYGITVWAGPHIFQTDPSAVDFLLSIYNDHIDLPNFPEPRDRYRVVSSSNLPFSPDILVPEIRWQLTDASAQALDTDGVSVQAPVLADWPEDVTSVLTIRTVTPPDPLREDVFTIRARVTSAVLVPEPAALGLLAAGLLALARRRRR